ncbi:response regulator transcription factor [Amycolatopsis thermoflava]|uniref:response regulator transcription factor n=1 Tax=Amycolatopsis thermoflava TaxID=84480 RepID=UPI000415375D
MTEMRAVLVHPDVWPDLVEWLRLKPIELLHHPSAPSQTQRYTMLPFQMVPLTVKRMRTPKPKTPLAASQVLTDREMQVLLGMSRGMTNGEIGRQIYISEDTVKTHARRMFRKLGVTDRAHAVAKGYETGLLSAVEA